MKICPNCHTQNFDIVTKCEKCNYPLTVENSEPPVMILQQATPIQSQSAFYVQPARNHALQSVAKAFMILSCVLFAIGFLTLFVLWAVSVSLQSSIPSLVFWIEMILFFLHLVFHICMTTHYCHKIADGKPVGIAFKIITLLFVDLIAGILMLCDNN